MKKIIFNGLVLDMNNGNYECSRGCYECDKSKKINKENKLDILFLKKIKKYFLEQNIIYSSISFNMLGNFFYNVDFFKHSIYIFLKLGLINPGNNILLYTKIKEQNIDLKNINTFFIKFTKYFKFTLGITIDLGVSYNLILRNFSQISNVLNIKGVDLRLIIQKPVKTKYSSYEQLDILNKLNYFKKNISIYFGEEELSGKEGILTIENLFGFTEYKKCMFINNNNIILNNNLISIDMLNISTDCISFHGPLCMKIKGLHIGVIGDNYETIKKNIKKSLERIKNIEKQYEQHGNKKGICDFCIKNY